jgi:peptidoglycan hydrolase-like protein with peptidoglycan-binding domain
MTAPHPARQRGRTIALTAVVVAALAGGAMLRQPFGEQADAQPAIGTGAAVTQSTTTVQRRTITESSSYAGTLTYQGAATVTAGLSGVVTSLPATGSVIAVGDVLYEVNGEPVVLLPGALPQWRALDSNSDDGADVQALEQALVELGYADPDRLTVDETFTSATGDAVAVFREAVGLSDGEFVQLGELLFVTDDVRVAGLLSSVGQTVNKGAAVLVGTNPTRVIELTLDASEQGALSVGEVVEVELPDGSITDATVTSVAEVARAVTPTGQNDATSYVLDVELTLTSGGDAFDEAAVTISTSSVLAADVLAVPVGALLALAEGGYALEAVTPDGTSLLAVQIGSFQDGWVEVTGDGVVDGLEVVTA